MKNMIASSKRTGEVVPQTWRIRKHRGEAVRNVLLICGILSSLWYMAVSIVVPLYDSGYSSFSQTVSELSAIGAPTRNLWVILCTLFTLLEIAFGVGVFRAAGVNRSLRITGGLLIAYGLAGAFWPPMHTREVLAAGGATLTDTLHIVFTAVTSLLMLLAMGFGASVLGKRFRLYSIVTVLTLLVFGTLTSLDAPQLQANLPTPWMGVWERINIYLTMLWMIVFAVCLLQREKKTTAPKPLYAE